MRVDQENLDENRGEYMKLDNQSHDLGLSDIDKPNNARSIHANASQIHDALALEAPRAP